MRNAADQVVSLAKQTPHRVVRELYEQFIAYGRAYADSIANYTPVNGYLAAANVNVGNTLKGICLAIAYNSFSRSLAIQSAPNPSEAVSLGNLDDPQKAIGSPESACSAWLDAESKFLAATTDWGEAGS